MIAADRPSSARRTRSCSSSTRRGRDRTRAARGFVEFSAARRPGGRQRRRHAARQPARRARAERRARSRCGSPAARRSRPTTSRASPPSSFGARRLPHAHRGPPAAAAAARPAIGSPSGRCGAPSTALLGHPRLVRCASTARRTRSGQAWRATAGRSSTRTCRRRWRCGTCGRRSPARRSRSSRRRPASRWTGSVARGRCATRGVAFATLTHAAGISSTGDRRAGPPAAVRRALPHSRGDRAAIRSAVRRGGRVIAIGTTVVRALEHAAARDGGVRAGDGVATQRIGPRHAPPRRRCDPLRHARAGHAATTSCCARSPTTRRWRASTRELTRTATARTSSATRSSWRLPTRWSSSTTFRPGPRRSGTGISRQRFVTRDNRWTGAVAPRL